MNNFFNYYFNSFSEVAKKLDENTVERFVHILQKTKKNNGRVFFIGVGGSAGNCSHAVNDFRKLCKIESYTPVDNVSELIARINDEGWDNSFKDWLKASNFSQKDTLFVMSVGGGNKLKKVSTNLIKAIDLAKKKNSKVIGIVGKEDGYLAKKGNCVIIIPFISKQLLTPFAESFQSVIWHYLVSHPKLKKCQLNGKTIMPIQKIIKPSIKEPLFCGLTHIGQVFSIGWSEKIGKCSVFEFNKKSYEKFKKLNVTNEEPSLRKYLKKNIKKIKFCNSSDEIKKYENIFLTIDTPLEMNGNPKIKIIMNSIKKIKKYLGYKSNLIIISQVYCGFCENLKKNF